MQLSESRVRMDLGVVCGVELRKQCRVDIGLGVVLGECEEQVQLLWWEGDTWVNWHVGIERKFAGFGFMKN